MTNFYVTYTLDSREDRDAFYAEVSASGVIEASRKVYAGAEHPHTAQKPETLEI